MNKLSQELKRAYDKLRDAIFALPVSVQSDRLIEGTSEKIHLRELIAYQIGWTEYLIQWYQDGINGKTPCMPSKEFPKWDYAAIAKDFYHLHLYDSMETQLNRLDRFVNLVIDIIERESAANRLDQLGVWPWCTLKSGKKWPLSKWIRVNTIAPYKRASQLLRKVFRLMS